MRKQLPKFKELFQMAYGQSVTLRRRLMLYMMCLVCAAAGLLALLSIASGLFFNTEDRLIRLMKNQLEHVSDKMEKELENYEGYSLNLARQLSRTIEYRMEHKEQDIAEFNDSAEKLLELQRSMYGDLNTAILMGGSSGVYAVVDATVNSTLEEAGHSRSGLYLRLSNVSSNVMMVPDTVLFRGSAEIAREKGLELHNRWNLEFDTDLIPDYREMMDGKRYQNGNDAGNMFWTDRMQLKDTWEKVILLCVPIQGSSGNIYGLCGAEISAVHFKMEYPVLESDYGSIIMAAAPLEDSGMRLDLGITGSIEGTWLSDTEKLEIVPGKKFNVYRSENEEFLGFQKVLDISGQDGKQWAVAVLIPRERSMNYIQRSRLCMMVIAAAFIFCMLLLALHLSRRFVQPILQGFDDIKEERQGDDTSALVRIAELDELKAFVRAKRQSRQIGDLPENIEEMLRDFQKRAESLTPTERVLLRYYVEDYSLEEIAEKMFISIGTAKKHNTNLNRKLGITAKSQLMVYIELFQRCNRLKDIIGEEKEKQTENRQ